jgi:hypothetical protein
MTPIRRLPFVFGLALGAAALLGHPEALHAG